jgi:hypothetical protein
VEQQRKLGLASDDDVALKWPIKQWSEHPCH